MAIFFLQPFLFKSSVIIKATMVSCNSVTFKKSQSNKEYIIIIVIHLSSGIQKNHPQPNVI